jgi:hypothetical protein
VGNDKIYTHATYLVIDFMNIIYSIHAQEKIAERKIPKKIIESSLQRPDTVVSGRGKTKVAHKLIKDRLLRIVYRIENEKFMVITVYCTHPERYGE